MNQPGDDKLLADLARGDPRVFETLYVRYNQRLRLVAWRICRRGDWIDDLTSETWRRAFERKDHFDPTRDFLVWLTGILRNVAREQARRRRGDEPAPEQLDAIEPERIAAEAELLAALNDCVAALPPADRELVRLRFFEGRTLREVAERMKMPEATLRESRLPEACERLRDCLRSKGLEDFSLFSAQDGTFLQLHHGKGET